MNITSTTTYLTELADKAAKDHGNLETDIKSILAKAELARMEHKRSQKPQLVKIQQKPEPQPDVEPLVIEEEDAQNVANRAESQ